MQKGKNQTVTRDMNLSLIMSAFIKQPMSRADIARNFKLSKPAASKITAELESLDLICSGKEKEHLNTPGVKPIDYEINKNLGLITVMDMSSVEVKLQLCNFGGDLLAELKVPGMELIRRADLDFLSDMLSGLLAKPDFAAYENLCLCIAMPCAVNKNNGRIYWSARFDIADDFDFAVYLKNKFRTKILIKNDVHLYMMGERFKGLLTEDIKYALLVYIDAGIGGSFYMNGRLEDGADGTAGDVGYLPFREDGKSLLLDSVISINAIKNKLKKRLADAPSSCLRDKKDVHFKDIQQAYLYQKDPLATELVNRTAVQTAEALISLTEILNINYVILSGRITLLGDGYIDTIRKTVKPDYPGIKIRYSVLGDTAIREGAVMLALETLVNDKIKNRSRIGAAAD
jgi:predicted NBD/HSP70 family sugar kinase